MRLSARNVFDATVSRVHDGAVNAEVELKISGGESLVAIVTRSSVDRLELKPGSQAVAIIKASSVLLGRDLHNARISTRNILCGEVVEVVTGQVNSEVSLKLGGGSVLTAIITNESARRLELAPGVHVCAAFKASSVILGVE